MKEIMIVTNNSKVRASFEDRCTIIFVESFQDVLEKTRDLVHEGGILLTHPCASSLKPNQTPYRSVIVEKTNVRKLDINSLTMVEQAIETYEKFMAIRNLPEYSEAVKEDFKTIDESLMQSALVHWKGGIVK